MSESTIQETPAETPVVETPPETAPIEAKTPFKAKVKVDGEEFEVDEAELVANYQRAKSSMKRFEEAKKEKEEALALRSQADDIIKRFKENPKATLRDPSFGLNARQLAEELLMEEIEQELMDPKDREMRTLKEQFEALKREKDTKEQEAQEASSKSLEAQEIAKWTEVYKTEFPKALESAGLPHDQYHFNLLKDALLIDLEKGVDTPLNALAKEVKESVLAQQKQQITSLDPATLFELLGAEGYKKLSEFASAKFKPQAVKEVPKKTPVPSETSSALTKEERLAKMMRKLSEMS